MPEHKHTEFTTVPPVGGINYIGPAYLLNNLYTRDMKNMLIIDGIMTRRDGYEDVGGTYPNASNPVMEGFEYGDASGALHTIFVDTAELVEFTSPSTWNDRAGGSDLTGDATNPIFITTVGGLADEYLYITNGKDPIKRWIGTGNWSNLSLTGFTTLLAGCAVGYRGHLVLGDTTEDGSSYPYRVRWSKVGDPTVWNTTTAGFINLIEDDSNSEVMCMHPMKQVLMVYKFDSIYQLIYQGDPNYFIQIPREMSGGAISRKGVAPFEGGHFVVSNDNLHVFDGFSFIHPAPGNKIKRQFFSELNWDARGTIFAEAFPGRFEIHVLIPTGAATTPNADWTWNYKDNTWTRHEYTGTIHSLMNFQKSFSQTQPVMGLTGKPVKLFSGNTDGGTNIDSYFTTKPQNFRELSEVVGWNLERAFKTVHAVEIDPDAGLTIPKIQVGIQNVLSDTITYDTAQTPTVGPTGLYRVTNQTRNGRYLTLKISQTGSGAGFSINQYTLEVEPGENIR